MATGESFEAIVLAAGAGSRFGGGKLLAPWQGGVLINGALRAAFDAPVRTVRVVVGADAEKVAAAARAFADYRNEAFRLKIVEAANHAEGMGASLRAGADDLPDGIDGVLVFLADMPRIPPALPSALIVAVNDGAPAAAPILHGRRGHPVAFGARLVEDLRRVAGDSGARDVLRNLGDQVALIPVDDPGVLFDIDTPADLDDVGFR